MSLKRTFKRLLQQKSSFFLGHEKLISQMSYFPLNVYDLFLDSCRDNVRIVSCWGREFYPNDLLVLHLTVLISPFFESKRVCSGWSQPSITEHMTPSHSSCPGHGHLQPFTVPFPALQFCVPAVTEITGISVMLTKNSMRTEINSYI